MSTQGILEFSVFLFETNAREKSGAVVGKECGVGLGA